MPNNILAPSFTGGEFSPYLYPRVDLQKYSTGLKTAKNFLIHPYGGASNRPGTRFVAETKYFNKKSILKDFVFSNDQAYALEIGDLYIRFFRDGGRVETAPNTPYEVVTPYTEDDIEDLRFAQSNDVLYIVHPDHAPRALTRFGDTNWTLSVLSLNTGPFMSMNSTLTTLTPSPYNLSPTSLTASSPIFNSLQVGCLFKLNHFFPSSSEVSSNGNNIIPGISTALVYCKGNWSVRVSDLNGSMSGNIFVRVYYYINGVEQSPLTIRTINSPGDYYGSVGEFAKITVSSFDAVFVSVTLSSDSFEKESIYRVTAYNNSTNVSVTTLDFPPFNTGSSINQTTKEWSEGSFSDYRGYPSLVWFYQDRLSFASTYTEKQGMWFSKTSNYLDFGTSSPLVDTDSIAISLPARTQNEILNVIPLTKMLVFTSSNEWLVGPGQNGVFTPTSIEQNIQGYRGSSRIVPVTIGNRIIFVQSMGSVVRDFAYDLSADTYTGGDLTVFSTHLFKGYQIKQMAYQQEPDSIVWAVRDDGKLLSMTYMKEQEVLAWTPHETEGEFESVVSIPEVTYNQTWFIVKRGNNRYVEYLVNRFENTNPEDQFFVDCGISYDGAPTDSISGLEHLDGKTVAILGDGFVFPQQTISGGLINLPIEVSKAHIGIPYNSDFETLELELQTNEGPSMVKKIRVNSLFIRVYRSRGGYFGPDENNLTEFINRTTEGLDNPIELYSGKFKEVVDGTFDYGGKIFIRQSHPLPMTILAISPNITIGG